LAPVLVNCTIAAPVPVPTGRSAAWRAVVFREFAEHVFAAVPGDLGTPMETGEPGPVSLARHPVITAAAADTAATAIAPLRMLLFCMTSPELAVHGPDFAGARGGRQVRRTRGSGRAPPVTKR
jgi:hypothetical protein